MNVTLMIVTYRKDFPYLEWCLKSISKFASGFHEVRLLLPTGHEWKGCDAGATPLRITYYDEIAGKGMVQHELKIVEADLHCPGADLVAHIDSDTIFTDRVTPEFYMVGGLPRLNYEPFESITKRHPMVHLWQEHTQRCLPFRVLHETMRAPMMMHWTDTYRLTRLAIQEATGKRAEDYILEQENSFPQGFCEFVTLGNVALHYLPEQYHPIDQSREPNPDFVDNRVQQFWSHGPIDKPQEIWVRGSGRVVVPIQFIENLGL